MAKQATFSDSSATAAVTAIKAMRDSVSESFKAATDPGVKYMLKATRRNLTQALNALGAAVIVEGKDDEGDDE